MTQLTDTSTPLDLSRSRRGRRRRRLIRTLLLLLLLAFAGELIFMKVYREPYPGIFMPGFPGAGRERERFTVKRPEVVLTYEHGEPLTLSRREFLAPIHPSHHGSMIRVFKPKRGSATEQGAAESASETGQLSNRDQLELQRWVKRRAQALRPNARPMQMRVNWYRDTYQIGGQHAQHQSKLVGTFTLELHTSRSGNR